MPLRTADVRHAVNTACRLRLKYRWREPCFDPFLPISVEEGLHCCRYDTFCRMCSREPEAVSALDFSRDGFTVRQNGRSVIVYNGSQSRVRIRFTLAHELGHILLDHREDTPENDLLADTFARNLLMPVLYARHYGADFRHYPALFDVSVSAARMASRHYEEDLQSVWPSTRALVSKLLESDRCAKPGL